MKLTYQLGTQDKPYYRFVNLLSIRLHHTFVVEFALNVRQRRINKLRALDKQKDKLGFTKRSF
jgi:hypothetical protein